MMDKDSRWGYNNGLKTLIPHALTFGVIGYPFVLPDMIGNKLIYINICTHTNINTQTYTLTHTHRHTHTCTHTHKQEGSSATYLYSQI